MAYNTYANRIIENISAYSRITQTDEPSSADNVPYYILDGTTPPPAGFINNSAKCWINSLMQALLSIAPLYEAIRLTSRPTPVAKYFAEMYIAAHGHNPKKSCDQLLEVIAASKTVKRGAKFDFSAQNCAQEAYTLIMDCIGQPADDVAEIRRTLWETCPRCNKDSTERTITSNYFDVYSGELARAGIDRVAPLTTPSGFSMYLSMRPSPRDAFVCEHCKAPTNMTLTYSKLGTARSVITVVMHKYGSKPTTLYPLQLIFPAAHQGSLIYDLCAVIRHYGTMSAGHYAAIVRRGNPAADTVKWWLCNDTVVHELAQPPAPAAEDYMLFYVLRGVFVAPTD